MTATMRRLVATVVAMLWASVLAAQTISGTVTDAATGETLIGATVLDLMSGKGTVTNADGRYTLTLTADSARMQVRYTGYRPATTTVVLWAGARLNVALKPAVELSEVAVTAERVSSPKVSQMSAIEVPVEQIKLVPVLFGETDVLKAIQLLPGVQSGAEGTSGLYVRGGGPDENLFLLDGVPLYNVNHMGGFFSAFNGDAVKNVTLYKGSFPSRFAGRISSVVDIATNDGNDKEWHGSASLGLLSAKLGVEGPIVRERTTLSFSLRRTYADLLLQPMLAMAMMEEGGDGSLRAGYYFYDLNAKLVHRFSDRSRLSASFYSGDDEVYLREKYRDDTEAEGRIKEYMKLGYKWGNMAGSVRWNYELGPSLFMNASGSYTRYRNRLKMDVESESITPSYTEINDAEMMMNSGIEDVAARLDFDYTPLPEHLIKFGLQGMHHLFTPEVMSARLSYADRDTTVAMDTTLGQSQVRAWETTLYAEDDWSITEALKVNAGVVLSGFAVEGKFYPSVQPRLSGRLMLGDDLSVKAGYSYMTQYLHLLSSSNISLPSDLWVPVTARIAPMSSHQVAAGLFYSWHSLLEVSLEGYYKQMDNLMEYRPGSSFFGSSVRWEDKVCLGRGWAYGVELLVQKSVGKVTGWAGYTWSRTWRQFDELNEGAPYPAKYDRIHDVSLTVQYRPMEFMDMGLTWVYSTGNTATLATQEFEGADGYSYAFVESRNNYRLPAYHRMDVSINFHKALRRGRRTLGISVYNLYNRRNPFLIYKSYMHTYRANGMLYNAALVQRSIFPLLPTISYTYKF